MAPGWTLRKDKTLIAGILNVTPDSFSDGRLFFDAARAEVRAQEMLDRGNGV